MRAEIVTIGDEICRGEIVDTNAAWLSAALWELGIEVPWRVTCRDDAPDIALALTAAASRAELVLCTGGLGPTEDDLTVDVVCGLLGCEAVIDEPAAEQMRRRFAGTTRATHPLMLRQVRRPAGAAAWRNNVGLAPGFEFAHGGAAIFCFPGVPREMIDIFEGGVRARISELCARVRSPGDHIVERRVFRAFGLGESQVSARCRDIAPALAKTSVHYQVKFPETLVKFVRRAGGDAESDAADGELDRRVTAALGPWCYGTGDEALPALCARLLREGGISVATAESCTGGLLAALLTDAPGASTFFPGGVTTYADREKTRLLQVSSELLGEHGAVSEACVTQMASAARAQFATSLALAVSGIAGPGGGSAAKPVGTVWLALAHDAGITTRSIWFPGARDQVRLLAAWWGLRMIVAHIRGEVLVTGTPTS
ncbi:MAG: CinA family nicotinamide mononucleotide deamidase-related protein [Myxococcales bacterium]|nr:CinA family nicotinamide mononucleotide deamidase-related protein [Myxococcales bacterium]